MTLYRNMKDAGIEPNMTTYKTLIASCDRDGLVEEALAIMEDMKESSTPLQYDVVAQVIATCTSLDREAMVDSMIDEIINR